jgi:vacuolar-type H+-ATPase subunit I/STV1
MSENQEEFRKALHGKKVPILVLDQKWHRLFAIHGKPERVAKLEQKVNELLAREAKKKEELKSLKKVKNQLMDSIMHNMEGTAQNAEHSVKERVLEEDKRLMDETNEKIDACEEELLDLPNQIRDANETLMLESMDYIYDILRVNKREADAIEEWINQVRIDLKKNIIRKQNREINNHEMYSYLHDILGPEVLDLFDEEYAGSDTEKKES